MTSAKGLRNVSMLVAISGVNFCSFIADKRLICWDGTGNREVVSDSFPKIHRINARVIMGMTGMLVPKESITAPIDSLANKNSITLRQAAKATDYFGKMLDEVTAHRFYTISGKDENGLYGIYQIYFDHRSGKIMVNYLSPQPPIKNFAMSVSLPSTLVSRTSEISDTIAHMIQSARNHGDLLNSVGELIRNVSHQDFSVGEKISYMTVT